MLIKPRYESEELKTLRCLNDRMHLSTKDATYYLNLEKGFSGEQEFDIWSEDLPDDWLILNDLLFEINNTVFQIDSALIDHQTIYLIEVKNYEGDFYIKDDKWYTLNKSEIKNPLLQLERNETLFRQLLQELRINATIKSYIIFINPNFQLYQAPINHSIIFPTQLNRFKNKLSMKASKVKSTNFKSLEQLLSVHLDVSPYKKLPSYEYDQLEKGILCSECHTIIDNVQEEILVCARCGCIEGIESAILRSIVEYKILFPDRKITTSTIYNWCNGLKSKRTIRRVLFKNFKHMGINNASYYV